MICAEHISKAYPTKSLFHDLSFSLQEGINLIEGNSGCGKSTLIKILTGIEKPDMGKITYSKENLVFSYAGQDDSLIRGKTLAENIRLFSHETNADILEKLINCLGFHSRDKKIISMSGGERQKAEIIVCLSKIADVYVLDEPFSSLDSESKKNLVAFLNEFAENHYLILVNHDMSLDNLRISQTISLNESKEIQQGYGFRSVRSKDNTLFSLKSYFSDQKLFVFLKAVLLMASLIFFALGTSFVNTKSEIQRYESLLSQDPFSVHALRLRNIKSEDGLSSDFFSYASEKGNQYLELKETKSKHNVLFYGIPRLSYDSFEYYSGYDNDLFTQTLEISIGDEEATLTPTAKDGIEKSLPARSKYVQSVLDGYTQKDIILCSNAFIDQVLLSNPSNIQTSVGQVSFEDINGYTFSSANGELQSWLVYSGVNVIEDRNDYFISLPGDYAGKKIKERNTGCSVIVDSSSDDGKIHFSLALFKFLQMHGISYERDDSQYGYEFMDDDFIRAMKEYSASILPYDIYFDYSVNNTGYIAFWFPLSGITFLCYLFLVLFTGKSKRRWYRYQKSVFQRNQLSVSSLKKGILLGQIIEAMTGVLVSFVLYVLLFIPMANQRLMMQGIPTHPEGFYYYSQQPLYPYYDSITEPMKLITLEPIIMFVFLVSMIAVVASYCAITAEKKKDSK